MRRNISAHGFLIGAVLCFSFFSWYPMVREFILAFQKTEDGKTTWAGWSNLSYVVNDPAFWQAWRNTLLFTGLALLLGFAGPVRRRRRTQRIPARSGLLAAAGLSAGDAAAGRLGPALQVLLRPRLRTLQPHPGGLPPARPAVAPDHRHRDALRRHRGHLDEHGRRHPDLPRRTPGHPRRAVRGGRTGRRGTAAQDLARHRSRRPGSSSRCCC